MSSIQYHVVNVDYDIYHVMEIFEQQKDAEAFVKKMRAALRKSTRNARPPAKGQFREIWYKTAKTNYWSPHSIYRRSPEIPWEDHLYIYEYRSTTQIPRVRSTRPLHRDEK